MIISPSTDIVSPVYVLRCRDAGFTGTSEKSFWYVALEIMETAAPVSTSILRTLPLISISTVIGCTALDESFILNSGNSESVSLSFSGWPVSTQLVAPLCWCDFFLAAPVSVVCLGAL